MDSRLGFSIFCDEQEHDAENAPSKDGAQDEECNDDDNYDQMRPHRLDSSPEKAARDGEDVYEDVPRSPAVDEGEGESEEEMSAYPQSSPFHTHVLDLRDDGSEENEENKKEMDRDGDQENEPHSGTQPTNATVDDPFVVAPEPRFNRDPAPLFSSMVDEKHEEMSTIYEPHMGASVENTNAHDDAALVHGDGNIAGAETKLESNTAAAADDDMDATRLSSFSSAPDIDASLFKVRTNSPTKRGCPVKRSSPAKRDSSSSAKRPLDTTHSPRKSPRERPTAPETPGAVGLARAREFFGQEADLDVSESAGVDSRLNGSEGEAEAETTNLLEFTELFPGSAARNDDEKPRSSRASRPSASPSKVKSKSQSPPKQATAGSRGLRTSSASNNSKPCLLDLSVLSDLSVTPAATPRSRPTVTARELDFATAAAAAEATAALRAEVDALEGELMGRDEQVTALVEGMAAAETRAEKAEAQVAEAEETRRAGVEAAEAAATAAQKQMQSELRTEKERNERLERDMDNWTRRGEEMEAVLREVREQMQVEEREREKLVDRAEAADRAEREAEELRRRVPEIERELATAREDARVAQKAAVEARQAQQQQQQGQASSNNAHWEARDTDREVSEAVSRVARDLHTLYKGKHETKVAALKKSYENRWERRVHEAEARAREATEEVERLRTAKEATMSGVSVSAVMGQGQGDRLEAPGALDAVTLEKLAKVDKLEERIGELERDLEAARTDVQAERAEKGELVATVDEWLAVQAQTAGGEGEDGGADGQGASPVTAPQRAQTPVRRRPLVGHRRQSQAVYAGGATDSNDIDGAVVDNNTHSNAQDAGHDDDDTLLAPPTIKAVPATARKAPSTQQIPRFGTPGTSLGLKRQRTTGPGVGVSGASVLSGMSGSAGMQARLGLASAGSLAGRGKAGLGAGKSGSSSSSSSGGGGIGSGVGGSGSRSGMMSSIERMGRGL